MEEASVGEKADSFILKKTEASFFCTSLKFGLVYLLLSTTKTFQVEANKPGRNRTYYLLVTG